MKSNLLRLLAISLAAFLMLQTVPVSHAQKDLAGPAAQETIEGDWTGEITVGKETISVNVHFAAGADVSTGTAEVSGQKAVTLKSVSLRSNRVRFELPRDSSSFLFDGQLKGGRISGEVRRGKERGTFALVRVAQVEPKVAQAEPQVANVEPQVTQVEPKIDVPNVRPDELSQNRGTAAPKSADSSRGVKDFEPQGLLSWLYPQSGTSPARTMSLPSPRKLDPWGELREVNGASTAVGAQFVRDEEVHGILPGAVASPLIISEFRVRGPNGANDEYVEIYNNSNTSTMVAASSGGGFAVAASDAVVRCTIPNGTVIPGRGHYLCTNSVGYSLGGYATGDATFATDIADNAGIALFDNNVPANFILANRLDAVGSTSEADTLYKEGTGYPALTPFSIDYAFVRDACGQQGSITNLTPCPLTVGVADTGNNAVDFYFVDTNGTSAGAGQRLGSPGPENLASPIQRNASFNVFLPDQCVASQLPPNQIRDLTSVPAQNSTFGTIELRRYVVNNTGANVTRMRFRVTQQTTFPAPSGTADLRTRTTADTTDNFSNVPCGTGTSVITILGTTLEEPPSQPNGGAFNGTYSAGTVTLGTPIPPGNAVIVRFLWGVQQTGKFRIALNIEVLP